MVGNAVAAASGAEDRRCQEVESCSQYERHDLEVPGLCGEANHQRRCQDLPKPDKKTPLSDLTGMWIILATRLARCCSLKSKKIPKVKRNPESFSFFITAHFAFHFLCFGRASIYCVNMEEVVQTIQ